MINFIWKLHWGRIHIPYKWPILNVRFTIFSVFTQLCRLKFSFLKQDCMWSKKKKKNASIWTAWGYSGSLAEKVNKRFSGAHHELSIWVTALSRDGLHSWGFAAQNDRCNFHLLWHFIPELNNKLYFLSHAEIYWWLQILSPNPKSSWNKKLSHVWSGKHIHYIIWSWVF